MEAGRYDLSRSANQAFGAWCEVWARECLRVLKPGGHIAAFGGARTAHRLACAIEDAGFEMRDSLCWIFGSGFPKSLNVATAVEAAGGEGWEGWGTALKPAHEPIVLARKPFERAGVAANVLKHGVGGLNVDACRVGTSKDVSASPRRAPQGAAYGELGNDPGTGGGFDPNLGRWPANVVLTHTEDCVMVGERAGAPRRWPASRRSSRFGEMVEDSNGGSFSGQPSVTAPEEGCSTLEAWECAPGCPVRALDEQTGELASGTGAVKRASGAGYASGSMASRESRPAGTPNVEYGDAGGASRFFYCGKASRLERNAGLDAFETRPLLWSNGEANPGSFQSDGTERAAKNFHPTVKPLDLMRWLVRLVTPPGGTVLDPFTGSGTTGCACVLEGMEFVGIERDQDGDGNPMGYIAIAEARIAFWAARPVGIETERVLRSELEKPERRGQLSIL